MLTSPTHLRDELVRLDADLGGLPGRRVALLGFRDPNAARVEGNLRTLREAPGWTVVDVRQPASAPLPAALVAALPAPKLALLVDAAAPLPTDAALLVRALHDGSNTVRWAKGGETPLPANRILYVVAAGARALGDLPPALRPIDFMTFIRALK